MVSWTHELHKKENIELSLLSDLVAEYEDVHYPIKEKARTMYLKMNISPEMALGL